MIHLYSLDTPNGQKVGVALSEMELPFEVRSDLDLGRLIVHMEA